MEVGLKEQKQQKETKIVEEKISALKKNELFVDLNDDDLLDIACESTIKKYKKNQIIYSVGDTADTIILLISGSVKQFTMVREKETIDKLLCPNDVFGFETLYGKKRRGETAEVPSKNAICLLIPIQILKSYRKSHQMVSEACDRLVGGIINHLKNQKNDIVIKDARERIIIFLKDQAKSSGRQVGLEMLIKHSLTQQDIANYTGTSRQTVTYILNDLKRQNQIYFKRKSILIRDVANLN